MEGVKCKRCSTAFDETVRPRCLPCGHSFCSNCLDLIITEKLACPKCKKRHPASNGSDFPVNHALEENSLSRQKFVLKSLSQDHKAKSNMMKSLIFNQKREAEKLLNSSEYLQNQATFYEKHLMCQKSEHEEAANRLSLLLVQIYRKINIIEAERERMKIAFRDVTACWRSLEQKLSQMSDTQDTEEAIASIVSLDYSYADLEEWKERVYRPY